MKCVPKYLTEKAEGEVHHRQSRRPNEPVVHDIFICPDDADLEIF